MSSKAISRALMLVVAAFLVCSQRVSAFNITRLLSQYPDFSTFNDLITQTQLYQQINSRRTITVLVVSNSNVGSISGRPVDVLKRIISNHVVLDYYDVSKLQDLSKKFTLLTTLFQASGIASHQQGFLNVSKTSSGVLFGSAVKGASLSSKLVKPVAAQPYNISVLEISSPIVAPGIDVTDGNSTWSWNGNLSSPAPATDAPSDSPADAPEEDVPADAPESDAPGPAESDDAPTLAPGSSPSPSPSGDEADEEDVVEAPPPKSSTGRAAASIGVAGFMGFLVSLIVM